MTEPLGEETLCPRLEPAKALANAMLTGKDITPKNIERLARKALNVVHEAEAAWNEIARLRTENAALRAELAELAQAAELGAAGAFVAGMRVKGEE